MKLNRYQKLSVATVIATLLLIFVGGLVRAAGAGLGCPDWPTCFGLWIPPTSVEALPPGYDSAAFNPVHTWLEYVNRLTGVVIGLLITSTFLFSFRYWKHDRVVTFSAGLAFLLVLVQGWLGGQVVQSGLSVGLITLHMLLAMVIVTVLLFTAFRVKSNDLKLQLPDTLTRGRLLTVTALLLVMILIQMVLGTQVREMVDLLKNAQYPPSREEWLTMIEGWLYWVHRSFSWFILFAGGLLWWLNRRYETGDYFQSVATGVISLILFQIFLGVGLEWSDMAGAFQVLHLLVSALLICTVFLYLLMGWFAQSADNSPG